MRHAGERVGEGARSGADAEMLEAKFKGEKEEARVLDDGDPQATVMKMASGGFVRRTNVEYSRPA